MQFKSLYYIEEIDLEVPCTIEYDYSPAEPEVGLFEDSYDCLSVEIYVGNSTTEFAVAVQLDDFNEGVILDECIKFQEEL